MWKHLFTGEGNRFSVIFVFAELIPVCPTPRCSRTALECKYKIWARYLNCWLFVAVTFNVYIIQPVSSHLYLNILSEVIPLKVNQPFQTLCDQLCDTVQCIFCHYTCTRKLWFYTNNESNRVLNLNYTVSDKKGNPGHLRAPPSLCTVNLRSKVPLSRKNLWKNH